MSYVGAGEVSAVLRSAAEQPQLGVGGMSGAVVADVATTRGRYSLYRLELAAAGGGASPHFHRTFAESFHVVAGTVELFDGREWAPGRPGDHLFIPPGGVHGFRNSAPEPATMLMLSTPGVTRERYFAELAGVISEGKELSAEEWTALFARHDQYMV